MDVGALIICGKGRKCENRRMEQPLYHFVSRNVFFFFFEKIAYSPVLIYFSLLSHSLDFSIGFADCSSTKKRICRLCCEARLEACIFASLARRKSLEEEEETKMSTPFIFDPFSLLQVTTTQINTSTTYYILTNI